ncbi:hypothetical protein ONS95_008713 [Cadophora gregata]|uniref:uncharacterized protein n=1 Tax=Cadophora gregata TaxID=51156 RepID=UPI0026DCF4ED|nr:uncharacterized protein ONS95_008713 [Cadophora gregata]KAK0123703.1 hypothetical protein ONS95_008713 [Cadophora gregata]KAK0130048.1 hypothetical protein ONS96_000585 [Cadophora gregata f. sp. sojae]
MDTPVLKTGDEIQAEVFKWLKTTRYASTPLEPLTGGFANFIYRATLTSPLEDGSTEVVVKHGEPYMAGAPANKISIARCNIEAECFKALADFTVTEEVAAPTSQRDVTFRTSVRTPKVFLYDASTNTQVIEYLPNYANLKDYICSHINSATSFEMMPHCRALGKAIGQYISAFHKNSDVKLRETLRGNRQMQSLKHMINYDWMIDRVDQFPDILGGAKSVLTEVKDMALKELENEGDLSFIHGDLCPGNILITKAPLQHLSNRNNPVIITDWEQAQLNSPSLDHGEMLGELLAFHLYRSFDTGLWIAQGYVDGLGNLSEEEKRRNALQVGVHLLAFGPIAGWVMDDDEGKNLKERVMGVSRDLVVNAWERNVKWFREGEGNVFGFLI